MIWHKLHVPRFSFIASLTFHKKFHTADARCSKLDEVKYIFVDEREEEGSFHPNRREDEGSFPAHHHRRTICVRRTKRRGKKGKQKRNMRKSLRRPKEISDSFLFFLRKAKQEIVVANLTDV